MRQNKQIEWTEQVNKYQTEKERKFKKDDLHYGDEHICIQNVPVRKWNEPTVNFPGQFKFIDILQQQRVNFRHHPNVRQSP
jgi:hypothetical protein